MNLGLGQDDRAGFKASMAAGMCAFSALKGYYLVAVIFALAAALFGWDYIVRRRKHPSE
nr:hypothetical protein [uncultured Sphingomonas sp.]